MESQTAPNDTYAALCFDQPRLRGGAADVRSFREAWEHDLTRVRVTRPFLSGVQQLLQFAPDASELQLEAQRLVLFIVLQWVPYAVQASNGAVLGHYHVEAEQAIPAMDAREQQEQEQLETIVAETQDDDDFVFESMEVAPAAATTPPPPATTSAVATDQERLVAIATALVKADEFLSSSAAAALLLQHRSEQLDAAVSAWIDHMGSEHVVEQFVWFLRDILVQDPSVVVVLVPPVLGQLAKRATTWHRRLALSFLAVIPTMALGDRLLVPVPVQEALLSVAAVSIAQSSSIKASEDQLAQLSLASSIVNAVIPLLPTTLATADLLLSTGLVRALVAAASSLPVDKGKPEVADTLLRLATLHSTTVVPFVAKAGAASDLGPTSVLWSLLLCANPLDGVAAADRRTLLEAATKGTEQLASSSKRFSEFLSRLQQWRAASPAFSSKLFGAKSSYRTLLSALQEKIKKQRSELVASNNSNILFSEPAKKVDKDDEGSNDSVPPPPVRSTAAADAEELALQLALLKNILLDSDLSSKRD